MKTCFRRARVTAAWICMALPSSIGLTFAAQPSVKGDIGRLTLLPGPYLLSPARTTPTLMPSPIKLQDASPSTPATPRFLSGGGSLRLIERPDAPAVPPRGIPDAERRHPAPPSPESLRFDATLEPPPASIRVPVRRK